MKVDFAEFFRKLKEEEEKYGVKIHFSESDCHDENHLDCIWYGGEVGIIEYQDVKIIIGAYGDIRLHGMINGTSFEYKDKNNSGDAFYEFGHLLTDEQFYHLTTTSEEDDANNFICVENGNWFEVNLVDADGNWIDLSGADNVLSDNILDCFSDVSDYFKYVDWWKERKKS